MKVEDIPFEPYVRKPFDVFAVQITDENIAELAPFIGTLTQEENGRNVILVDRKLIRNLDKVYVGYWLTKMGTTLRCYSKNAFAKHFMPANDPANSITLTTTNPPLVTWNVSNMEVTVPQSQEISESVEIAD